MARSRQSKLSSEAKNEENSIPGDEISIVELIKDIGRQWKVVAGVTILCGLTALSYTSFKENYYRYTLEIEIGQMPREDLPEGANIIMFPPADLQPKLFEPANVVQSQLSNEWLPNAMEEVAEEQEIRDFERDIPIFEFSNPESSGSEISSLIKVTGDSPKELETFTKAVLRRTGASAVAQHASYLEHYLRKYKDGVNRRNRKQENLKERLEGQQNRILELQDIADQSHNRALAASVELHTLIPEHRDLLEKAAELENAIAEFESRIEILETAIQVFRISNLDRKELDRQQQAAASLSSRMSLRPTRVLNLPKHGNGPLGENPRLLLVLALVLGLSVGVVLAIIVQAIVRERD